MEVGVRILGVVLRILNLLLAPLFWLRARDRRQLTAPKPLLLRSATQHADAVRTGEITSEELVTAYIERVKEVNPLLNAVVDERFRAALEDAKEVDRRIEEARRSGKLEQLFAGRPLLGVPFTVKESCSLAGLSNAVGCLEFAGRRATADGAAVRLVKEAGAIPLLVSNTPELCLGWETTNLLRGTTNNPFCLDRTPGGSSGGEGALLAAGASAVSVASDIAGSIRLPAAFCGVFGHKPTPGIIPIEGHIPTLGDSRFPEYLGVGPMARAADDLMLMLKVLTGAPPRLRLHDPVDFTKLKVYYMTESTMSIAMLDVDSGIKDTIRSAAKYLQAECGATICEEKFKDLEDSVEMSVSEFFSMKDIPNLLQDPANPKRDKSILLELIKYLFNGGTRSLQALCFALIARHQLCIPAARRPHYRRKAHRLKDHIESTLGTDGVFLYPVFTGAAHYHGQVYLRAAAVQYAMLANALGLPAAAVPRPRASMPHALQVIAAPYQDRLCLAVAKQLEKAFGGWKPPGI